MTYLQKVKKPLGHGIPLDLRHTSLTTIIFLQPNFKLLSKCSRNIHSVKAENGLNYSTAPKT